MRIWYELIKKTKTNYRRPFKLLKFKYRKRIQIWRSWGREWHIWKERRADEIIRAETFLMSNVNLMICFESRRISTWTWKFNIKSFRCSIKSFKRTKIHKLIDSWNNFNSIIRVIKNKDKLSKGWMNKLEQRIADINCCLINWNRLKRMRLALLHLLIIERYWRN